MVGTRVILPSLHQGSHLQQRYQDAMATVRVLGKPHLFITMTCNLMWPEIVEVIKQWNATSVDCPTIAVRQDRGFPQIHTYRNPRHSLVHLQDPISGDNVHEGVRVSETR